MATFNPYLNWLGIPVEEQLPNHYRLLGIGLFESNHDVISNAADRQMAHVRTFQLGSYAELSQRLLNELAAARVCLLDDKNRAAYDRQLRDQLAATSTTTSPVQSTHSEADSPPVSTVGASESFPSAAEAEEEQDDDGLGLAPIDDEPTKKKSKPPELKTSKPPSTAGEKPRTTPPLKKSTPQSSLVDEELANLDGFAAELGPLEDIDSSEAETGGPAATLGLVRPKRKGLRALFSQAANNLGEKKNVWDSPLLLITGGTLLGLLILGSVLYWAVMRGSGDEALRLANEEFDASSYTQAIAKYNQYLIKFPKHDGTSLARIRRNLCQLRQATAQGTTNWSSALITAKKLVREMAPEADFKEAHGDLSVMLTTIAEGLASQAQEVPGTQRVAEAYEALAQLEKYVPKVLQQPTRITEIKASLALTERKIVREVELEKALQAMISAAEAGKTTKAYVIRKELLKQYPQLVDNNKLVAAVRKISAAQKSTVETIKAVITAETTNRDTSVASATTLARTSLSAEVPDRADQVVAVGAEGAAYSLDASTGRVLWRRFMGFSNSSQGPAFPPTPISAEPGADLLLVDPMANELQRVESRTGSICWRLAVNEPFDAHPVMTSTMILLVTRSGKLLYVDPNTGTSSKYIQLPQRCRVAPAVDINRGLIYQPADHSNLFVLSLSDGRCQQVVYLGHSPGTITTPPVLVEGYLILTVNNLAEDAHLHVLAVDSSKQPDSPLCKPIQELRIRGHVDTPPSVAGRRILVVTDMGITTVFDLGRPDAKKALRKVAPSTGGDKNQLLRYTFMQEGYFWLADDQLTKYDILMAQKRLVPRWIIDEQSVFLEPLKAIGQTIFAVRRKQNIPGVRISAIEMEEPNRYWETHVAAPLVTEPMLTTSEGPIIAITSDGALFRLKASNLDGKVVNDSIVALDSALLSGSITSVLRFETGSLALSTGRGSKQLAVFDPQQPKRFRPLLLSDPLACQPLALGNGVLAPTLPGQIFLVDPASGTNLLEPFMPKVESGKTVNWSPPVAISQNQVILSDGQSTLYRLGVKEAPKPHLAALAKVNLSSPITKPVGVTGELVYAADSAGVVTVFNIEQLTPGKQWPLAGHPALGPTRVGDYVIVSTDEDQLLCFNSEGKIAWQGTLPYGPLAGLPLASGPDIVFASVSGVIWRVDASSGQQQGKVHLTRPLGTGPVLYGKQLLLGGHDGTLYTVKAP